MWSLITLVALFGPPLDSVDFKARQLELTRAGWTASGPFTLHAGSVFVQGSNVSKLESPQCTASTFETKDPLTIQGLGVSLYTTGLGIATKSDDFAHRISACAHPQGSRPVRRGFLGYFAESKKRTAYFRRPCIHGVHFAQTLHGRLRPRRPQSIHAKAAGYRGLFCG